jgi:hypothetical protein
MDPTFEQVREKVNFPKECPRQGENLLKRIR